MKQPFLGKSLFCSLLFLLIYEASFSQGDNFASALSVSTTSTCVTGTNQFAHSLTGATNEAATISGIGCGTSNTRPDKWYKFTTQTEFPIITVTPTGTSWTTTVPIKIQILSGTALTSLAQVACGTSAGSGTIIGTPVTVVPGSALTPGTTYYVRISKGTTGNPTGSTWDYNICIKEGTASRLGEVFKQTILSAAGVLNYPWEVTYGPDGNLWVTEAQGYRLNKINPNTGAKTVVLDLSQGSTWLTTNGAPAGSDTLAAANSSVWNGSPWPIGTATNPIWPQGGFAGMALHPNFLDGSGTQDFVYVTYVHRYLSGGGTYGGIRFRNKIVRFTYNSGTGKFSSPVIIANDLPGSSDHNSQRMLIAPVGGVNYLFMAAGDLGAGQFGNRDRINYSQNQNILEGKILRYNLESDGDAGALAFIPNDNPFGASNPVWALGIRNNQGLVYDAASGLMYGSSHGPYSDDEINIIESGKNYGHPLVIGYSSDGNYNGTTAQPLNTSVTAGAPFTDNNGVSACPPIGNEAANATTIGSTYRDPLFCAYASSNATIKTNWKDNTGNAGWESEAWSGLDLYSNKMIPGWKQSLIASGLKWGRMIKVKLNAAGTGLQPAVVIGSPYMDTVTYFQSGNRYRDLAVAPNGKDIFLVMDNSSATSGPGVGNPTVPACPGCVIKYSFLGYVSDGATTYGGSTIPKTIDVTAPAVNNTCIAGNTVTINAANNNTTLWVPITGPDGNILAEINANGNDLGTVTSSVYKNSGAIRVKGGVRFLDRNITITPQNQPTLPSGSPLVKIRLYFSKAEFDVLDADGLSGLTGSNAVNLLKILKNSDACGSTIASTTTAFTPTNTTTSADWTQGPNGYVLQANISGFSSFYFATSNVTLPLDLLTFKGNLQNNNTVLLQWETANEINSSHFVVERSSDAVNFSAIGNVAAHGNTTTNIQYSLTDNNIINFPSPIIYYRLKMVDIDGQFKYSSIVPITLADITGNVTATPNPVVSDVLVSISAPADGKVQWKLVDVTGRVVLQNTTAVKKGTGNTVTINMARLNSGAYYLTVTGAGVDKKVKLEKL